MGDSQKPLRVKWIMRPVVRLVACASLACALLYPLKASGAQDTATAGRPTDVAPRADGKGNVWYGPVRTSLDATVQDTATEIVARIIAHLAKDVAGRMVPAPQGLAVVGQRCRHVNAFYSPSKREINICIELIDNLLQGFSEHYSKWNPTDFQIREIVFAAGLFFAYHELGHAVMHLQNIPITGREEDAADAFATWWLISIGIPGGPASASVALDLFSPRDRSTNNSDQYGYAHGLPEQRRSNLLCWLAGSGTEPPDGMLKHYLPASRLLQCRDEYASINRTWAKLMGGSLRR